MVMTTWHSNDSLVEALDFFAMSAVPTDSFSEDSGFWLVICVGRPDWSATARGFLQSAAFFI